MKRLENKVAIITGATRGIGKAIAQRFVSEGAKVLVVGRDEKLLKELVAELGSEQASYEAADVSKTEEVTRYVQTALQRYGGIDILVSNAGTMGTMLPIEFDNEENFRNVFDVNVFGSWLNVKHVLPHMKAKGGSIIIMSSIAGHRGGAAAAEYIMSKAALTALARCAAIEGAPYQVRANAISPGFIRTDMMEVVENTYSPENPGAIAQTFAEAVPLKRYGKPEEVANLALFLASDESSYVSGSEYVIDAGRTVQFN